MNKLEQANIEEMLKSPDKEAVYLGVSILRNLRKEPSTNWIGQLISSLDNKEEKMIKSVPLKDRIKTIEDVMFELNLKLEDVLLFKEPKSKQERYLNACVLIPLITKVFNGGWIEKFDGSQNNHFPYFEKNRSGSGWVLHGVHGWSPFCYVSGGFYYKDEKTCRECIAIFQEYYNDWLPLI